MVGKERRVADLSALLSSEAQHSITAKVRGQDAKIVGDYYSAGRARHHYWINRRTLPAWRCRRVGA